MLVNIDEKLIQTALEVSGIDLNHQELVQMIILNFIRNESGKRLMELGGQALNMQSIPRQRSGDPK